MELFKQVAIPGKGQGLVASRDVEKGTRVLSESPLLTVPGNTGIVGPMLKAFEGLALPDRQTFGSLHRYMHPLHSQKLAQFFGKPIAEINPLVFVVIATFINNHLGNHVFLQGSRINHSCVPNLEWAWNVNINQGTFHAIKSIKVGEELTISYIRGANWTKEKRALALQKWDFACSCPSCDNSTDAKIDEKWRAESGVKIASLAQEEERGASEDWTKKCQDICNGVASGLQTQGTPTREVSEWFRKAAMYAWRSGTLHTTAHYANKSLSHEKICIGTDHLDYIRGQQILAQIHGAAKDQEAFASAKRAHPSEGADDFSRLAEATDKYNGRMKKPEPDWRLQKPVKALWWAEVDMAGEMHDHLDKEHVAILRKEVDVEFLKERVGAARGNVSVNPYQEITAWLEGGS